MKKILSILLMALLSCSLLFGCVTVGNGGKEPEDTFEVSLDIDPNIEAEISIVVPSGNDNEKDMINCLIEDFAIMYPNVTVNMEYVSVNKYESEIRQKAAAGTLADIIWSNSPDFYYLVNKGFVTNLSPYIEASEKANVFNFEETFFKEFFDCGTLNDKLYCVPRSCDSVVTFYNKEMFESAGVAMNTVKNGWTWDEFLAACAKLRTHFDKTGKNSDYIIDANLTGWLSVNYPMLLSYGGAVLDEKGNVVLNSEGTKKCLEMVRYMVEQRYIVDSSQSSGSSFETGTSAMLFQSSSFSHYAERKALKGKIDLVSFPLIQDNNTPKIGSGIAGYSIKRDSKYRDLCWQFLNLMLSYDGQQKMALNGLNLASIRKDLANSAEANWSKKYAANNLSAYMYGSEYKVDAKFLSYTTLTAKSDITDAVKDLFTYAQDKSREIPAAITKFTDDIVSAIEDANE